MIAAPRLALGLALLAIAGAGCSTDPGNNYGSGGTSGTIQVRDSMIGSKGDLTDFTITIESQTKPVAQNGIVAFGGLAPNDYAVTIGALGKCTANGGNTQEAQVFAGYTQYMMFVTTCP